MGPLTVELVTGELVVCRLPATRNFPAARRVQSSMRRLLLLCALSCLAIPASAEARVVLVATGDGFATLVGVSTGKVENRINVGGRTRGAAVTPDGRRGFVTAGRDVVALDLDARTAVARITRPGTPLALGVVPDGSRLLALRRGAIDAIDVATMQVVRTYSLGKGTDPSAMAIGAGGTRALVILDSKRLASVDLAGGSVKRIRLARATGVAFPTTGTTAYAVAMTRKDTRLVGVNTDRGRIGVTSKLRRGPGGGIAITADGRRAVLGAARGARVTAVVDLGTRKTVARVAAGRGPGFPAVGDDGLRIYVADQSGGSVSVISGLSYKRLAARSLPAGSRPAAVAVQGGVATQRGTEGPDVLRGTRGLDLLDGLGGDDLLTGGRANDTLLGGAGNDAMDGGPANDILDGGDGHDRMTSQAGDDDIIGGLGDDVANGGTGNDDVEGGEGNDALDGGDGDDMIEGGPGDDRIIEAGLGNDFLLDGGPGNDFVNGNRGTDKIEGGDGDDTLLGGPGGESIDAGTGNDTVDGGTGGDQIYGREGNDSLRGDAGRDSIYGSTGGDTIDGGSGDDYLTSSDGDDVVIAGPGADEVLGGRGKDEIRVADGDSDDVDCGSNTDTVYVEQDAPQRDTIRNCEKVVLIPAEPSTDAPPTSNNIFGTAGNDTLVGTEGVDSLFGNDGDDKLFGAGDGDYVDGENGNDELHGGLGNDELHGRNDNDVVLGNEGDDDLTGDRGNDTLNGGPGNDTLNGNLDDDIVEGAEGDDRIQAVGGGVDRISCGDGFDVVFADAQDAVAADCEDVRR